MADEPLPRSFLDGIAEIKRGDLSYLRHDTLTEQLTSLWEDEIVFYQRSADYSIKEKGPGPVDSREGPDRPPEWLIGITKTFRKDIDKIDKKLQGRILEALSDISADPVQVRGDTIKPLANSFEGCWRYRIGDFRLVYRPDVAGRKIALLAFSSRGSIYD